MANRGYPAVPYYLPDELLHRRKLAGSINNLIAGRLNCTLDITLTASVTTTTIIDPRISATAYIDFMPLTAAAATAKSSIFITDRKKGQATINHASNAAVDQDFVALIIG